MDPSAVGIYEWSELGVLLSTTWIVVAFVVLFAASVILGHNIIPSLVASGHISRRWQLMRPGFYLVALASLAVAVFFLSDAVTTAADLIPRIVEGFWI